MCAYITGFSTYVPYMSMYTSEGLPECEHILVDVNIHSLVLWSVCVVPASKYIRIKQRTCCQGLYCCPGIQARERCEKAWLNLEVWRIHGL